MKVKLLDGVIIAFVLILALAILLFSDKGGRQPDTAVISVDGAEQRITLPAHEEISVNGVVIEIEDYAAYVKESDCPDKTCVDTGELTLSGQRSVCLPNRVILSLEGSNGVHVTVG